jgi:thymidylate synthase
MRTYNNIHQAYLGTIQDVLDNPDFICSPRGQKILEKTDYTFRVRMPTCEPIVTADPDRNKTIAEYTAKEMALYDSCSNSVEDFAKASKFWEKIANPDGTINSAYGHLIWDKKSQGNTFESKEYDPDRGGYYPTNMRTPWEWAKQTLIADKDTRQAVMAFALPEHRWVGNKDQVCTLHGNWLIRDDLLNLSIVMRSNDLSKGLVYDLSWFVSLMDKMVKELKPTHPDLHKGTYTHTAHSMHIYERDILQMKKMLGRS